MNLREAAQQALEFCEFLWREVPMNEYAEELREKVESTLRAALAEPWAHVSHVQSEEETYGLHSAECRHECDNGAESK